MSNSIDSVIIFQDFAEIFKLNKKMLYLLEAPKLVTAEFDNFIETKKQRFFSIKSKYFYLNALAINRSEMVFKK